MALRIDFSRRPFKNYRPVYFTTVFAGVLGLLLLALNLRDFFDFRRSAAGTRTEIARLNGSAAGLEQNAARTRQRLAALRLKSLQEESLRLNALLRERQFSWMLLLARLERVLPDEVFLTKVSPTVGADGTVSLSLGCVGRNPESIVKTLSALARDSHFTHAMPLNETDPEKGSPEGFRFRLTVAYRPAESS